MYSVREIDSLPEFARRMRFKEGLRSILYNSHDPELTALADKMSDCGSQVDLAISEDGVVNVVGGRFCRQRLCPMCQWRRSLRLSFLMEDVISSLEKYDFLHVVLSRPNCSAAELKSEIQALYAAFNLMWKSPKVKQAWKGAYRSTEVTYNEDAGTYHPHLHVLVAVLPSYFTSRYYISHELLNEMWNKANLWSAEYDLNTYITRLKGNNKKDILREVTKYINKPVPIESVGKRGDCIEQMFVYNSVLHGRRMVQTYGVLKDAISEEKLRAAEEMLDNVDLSILKNLTLEWKENGSDMGYVQRSGS